MTERHAIRLVLRALPAVVALLGTTVAALADRSDWTPMLTVQIFDEHQCVVAFLSQVVEREVDGRPVVIAKAHCEDRRAFDVYREGPLGRFEITECEAPSLEAC